MKLKFAVTDRDPQKKEPVKRDDAERLLSFLQFDITFFLFPFFNFPP